jgi:type IV pilus assembly protein PilB
MPVKIGEMLQKEGLITPQQLQEALTHQKQNGVKLGRALVSLGFVKDDEITGLLSRQYGVPSINLATFDIDPTVLKVLPGETCRKYQVIPISRAGAVLSLAMSDPTNVFAMDDIKFMTGYNVDPVVASEIAIEEAINRFYGSARSLTLRQDGALPAVTSNRSGGPGKAPSLKDVIDGPALTFDDMASVGLSEVDIDAIGEEEGEVETLKTEEDEIDLGALSRSSEAAPVVKLANVLLIDSL